MSRPRGMTLVEMLVVTAILSVLAVGVTLTAARPGAGMSDARLFAMAYDDARNRAAIGGARLGLVVTPDGLRRAAHTVEGWRIDDRGLRWRGRVAWAGPVAPAGIPGIVLLGTGQTSPVDVVFFDDSEGAVRCRTDGWRALACDG